MALFASSFHDSDFIKIIQKFADQKEVENLLKIVESDRISDKQRLAAVELALKKLGVKA